MKLKPVNDKIVVKPVIKEDDHITEGGILLPDIANQGGLLEGEVVSAGHGMYSSTGTLIPLAVEVGDTVLYSKHNGGESYKLDGEELLIMSQNEVLSILQK